MKEGSWSCGQQKGRKKGSNKWEGASWRVPGVFVELGTWSVESEEGLSEDEIRQAVGSLLT